MVIPELWQRIERIYEDTRQLDPGGWREFLDQACAGDETLRREVESPLAYEPGTKDFIETPALQIAAEQLAAESPQLVGESLGPYLLVSLLGRGGMGEVYRARDTRLAREVAVKVLPAGVTEAMRRRFEQETRAASRLNYPNILSVYDVGHDRGVF
jgi:serine/threonine protein kinase